MLPGSSGTVTVVSVTLVRSSVTVLKLKLVFIHANTRSVES